jgi:hypothetical protein
MVEGNADAQTLAQKKTSLLSLILPLFAPLFFVATTVIGAVRWFSPVPFWDMWDGTLGFYIERLEGHRWAPFLAQANEHRIILSKILFWVDYRFFGGLSHFLIPVHIVLMFALWASLWWASRLLLDRRLAYLCGALSGVPCLSWLQYDNVTWAYQSQFYLAYLLPLLALISMARWIREPQAGWFAITILLGVLSACTMANGLLALPLLIIMLALSGQSTRYRMGALLFITAMTFAVWSHNYVVQHRPVASFRNTAEFALLFLGAPFEVIFHERHLTILMGAATICGALYAALRCIGRERDPVFVALILFAVHVGAAAAAAAHGRAYFGYDAAFAGRYETPVLLLYSTLMLLFVYLYRDRSSTYGVVVALSVCVPILLFSSQMFAFDAAGPARAHQRMKAALALDMSVKDDAEIGKLYLVDQARKRTSEAIQYNLSVFATPLMRSAREAIGKTTASLGLRPCQSSVDAVAPIATDNRYVSVQGWAFDNDAHTVPPLVFFATNGEVTGAAVTGAERSDVRRVFGRKAIMAGFDGYALHADRGELAVYCER